MLERRIDLLNKGSNRHTKTKIPIEKITNNWLSNDQKNALNDLKDNSNHPKDNSILKKQELKKNRIQSAHQSRDKNRNNLEKNNLESKFSLLETEKVNKIFTTEDMSYMQGENNMTESISKPKNSIVSGYSLREKITSNNHAFKKNSKSKIYESMVVYPPGHRSKFNVRGLGFSNENTRILADNDPLVQMSNNLYNSCHPYSSQKEIQYERCHGHNHAVKSIMKMELNQDMLKLLDNYTVTEPRSAFFKCFNNVQLRTILKLMEIEMQKLLPVVMLLDEFIEQGHLLYRNRPTEIIEKNDPMYKENSKNPFVTLDLEELNKKWSKID